ncbi:MAG: CsbD family protein [Actinomycetota bacterium]|nr:CsbD family protein [Actinomycetota bacterium]
MVAICKHYACCGLCSALIGHNRGMQIGTVDLDKLRGVSDKFVGLAKETTGVIINNSGLQKAGEAQQDRATETLKALRKEAEAETKSRKSDSIAKGQGKSSGGGVFAEAKGKVKEAAGRSVGNRDLQDDGEADQQRGSADRQSAKAKTEAKAHSAKAKVDEKAQESAEESS